MNWTYEGNSRKIGSFNSVWNVPASLETFPRALDSNSTGCRTNSTGVRIQIQGRTSTTFGRNRDSQTKNPQTNITENKQIELNTVHGEGSASEADLEDVSEIPSILLPGLGRNKTFTYQNQFMISFMNANYIQIAYLTRTSKVFVLWMDLWFQGQ